MAAGSREACADPKMRGPLALSFGGDVPPLQAPGRGQGDRADAEIRSPGDGLEGGLRKPPAGSTARSARRSPGWQG